MTMNDEKSNYMQNFYKNVRRVFILLIGLTVLLCGIVLLFLPGPAFLVIPVGLAILATEFVWAKVLLDRIKEKIQTTIENHKSKKTS